MAGVAFTAPNVADACGSLCAPAPPPGPQSIPIPLDQTGEDILFAVGEDSMEVHVRIQYDGAAADFAWIVPMQSVPSGYAVGSDALIQAVREATAPEITLIEEQDSCGGGVSDSAAVSTAPATGPTSMSTSAGSADEGADVVVFAQTKVGAFDVTVLTGGSAIEVMTWLADNGYADDPELEPILDEYLAEGHVFAAIKLQGGADVDEIHPIVFEFDRIEPCVPLRLTRVAAVDDLQVRVFYLGDHQAAPTNYRHVVLNPVAIDPSGSRYAAAVVAAVDSEHADGRAFVTEWAGSSNIVSRTGLRDWRWAPDRFADIPLADIGTELQEQALYVCDDSGCGSLHPLLDGLLAEYLPVPDGLTPQAFYGDLAAHVDAIDVAAWGDGTGFAAALQERVVEPGERAVEALSTFPYLTRLFTLISPHEMLEDPVFHQNPDLDDTTTNRRIRQRTLCSGDSVYTLDDGREVFVPAGAPWPVIPGMPAAEDVQEVPPIGAPMALADHTETIDELLAAYNASLGWPGAGSESDTEDDAGLGGSGEGCGCRGGPASPAGVAVFMLLALGLRRLDGVNARA